MHDMENLKYMLMDEVEEFERKGKLTSGDLPTVHMLTDTIKNICKINMYSEEEEGYSREGGNWNARGSYDGGESYARRKRDRMGRYSRDGGGGYSQGNSYRGYSRDGAKDYMMEQIEEMMREADPKDREALRKCMETMRNG